MFKEGSVREAILFGTACLVVGVLAEKGVKRFWAWRDEKMFARLNPDIHNLMVEVKRQPVREQGKSARF